MRDRHRHLPKGKKRLAIRLALDAAKGLRAKILKMPENQWAENFTSSKEEMLRSVDVEIEELRKKLR